MIDIENIEFDGAVFDSRLVRPGSLFVALKGEKSDGHDFINAALDKGAAGVIDGYGELDEAARRYRKTLRAKTAGITGSAGKTTTKELLKAFLSRLGKTHATEGNFNNHIGLPVTILNCPRDAEFLVLEMGTNHPGEIAHLCSVSSPDAGLVTGIGTAHIEFFGSKEAIAKEKGVLVREARDFAAVPGESPFIDIFRSMRPDGLIEAKTDPEWMEDALSGILPGAHNVSNASLAFSLAERYGFTKDMVSNALENFSLPGSRWKRFNAGGVNFIDDSYNASPDSMKAALSAFASMKVEGRKIAILGDMFELGEESPRYHAEVFAYAKKLGFDMTVAVGEASSAVHGGVRFGSAQSLKDAVKSILKPGDTVLLKASHGMGLGIVPEGMS